MADEDVQVVIETEAEVVEVAGLEGEAVEAVQEPEEDELVVSIGDEPEVVREPAPEWVRELRKADREKAKRIRELEAKLATPAETKPDPEPTMEAYDYDEDKFKAEWRDWNERQGEHKAEERKAEAKRDAEAKAWSERVQSYQEGKAKLRVPDYEEAEATITETLSVTQQGILIQGSENPALLAYAIGKNPAKAKELASITDPVKFAFAVAKLETQVKATTRKAATAPEKTLTGLSGAAGATDNQLERLREEAARTNDYSKVRAYKAKLRAA